MDARAWRVAVGDENIARGHQRVNERESLRSAHVGDGARLVAVHYMEVGADAPPATGAIRRELSPDVGSTCTTSAPRSASTAAPNGAAMLLVRSTTRTPVSGNPWIVRSGFPCSQSAWVDDHTHAWKRLTRSDATWSAWTPPSGKAPRCHQSLSAENVSTNMHVHHDTSSKD